VHLSLPSDLLEAQVDASAIVWPEPPAQVSGTSLADTTAVAILSAIAEAARPIVIAGPLMSNAGDRALLAKLEAATGAPAVVMESPRGMADATLGAFPDLIARADLIVLLGKALDFTLKWVSGPAFDPNVRLIAIDPDAAMVERARKEAERLLISCVADARARRGLCFPARGISRRAHRVGLPRPAQRSTAGRRNGPAWFRKRQAACIRPKCSARCDLTSNAIPIRC
jgi:acetolactate synthase-1/2/3 large subunit